MPKNDASVQITHTMTFTPQELQQYPHIIKRADEISIQVFPRLQPGRFDVQDYPGGVCYAFFDINKADTTISPYAGVVTLLAHPECLVGYHFISCNSFTDDQTHTTVDVMKVGPTALAKDYRGNNTIAKLTRDFTIQKKSAARKASRELVVLWTAGNPRFHEIAQHFPYQIPESEKADRWLEKALIAAYPPKVSREIIEDDLHGKVHHSRNGIPIPSSWIPSGCDNENAIIHMIQPTKANILYAWFKINGRCIESKLPSFLSNGCYRVLTFCATLSMPQWRMPFFSQKKSDQPSVTIEEPPQEKPLPMEAALAS